MNLHLIIGATRNEVLCGWDFVELTFVGKREINYCYTFQMTTAARVKGSTAKAKEREKVIKHLIKFYRGHLWMFFAFVWNSPLAHVVKNCYCSKLL